MPGATRKGSGRKYLYAHCGAADMFELAVGENVPRLLKAMTHAGARGLSPLIARDEETRNELVGRRLEIIARFARANNELERDILEYTASLEQSLSSDDERRLRAQFALSRKELTQARLYAKAARGTRVVGPEVLASLDPDHDVVDFLGHGAAGEDERSADAHGRYSFSLRTLARGVKAAGLLPEFRKFRDVSCWSANPKVLEAFVEDPRVHSGHFPWKTTAGGQRLVDELKRAGFTDPQVTAYQGAGVIYPPGPIAMRAIDEPHPIQVPRKTVKKVFTPRRAALACCLR